MGARLGFHLESPKDFAADLAVKLRERIYAEVVPALARGITAARSRAPST